MRRCFYRFGEELYVCAEEATEGEICKGERDHQQARAHTHHPDERTNEGRQERRKQEGRMETNCVMDAGWMQRRTCSSTRTRFDSYLHLHLPKSVLFLVFVFSGPESHISIRTTQHNTRVRRQEEARGRRRDEDGEGMNTNGMSQKAGTRGCLALRNSILLSSFFSFLLSALSSFRFSCLCVYSMCFYEPKQTAPPPTPHEQRARAPRTKEDAGRHRPNDGAKNKKKNRWCWGCGCNH